MTYKTYTHNFVVKNSNEVFENAELRCKNTSDNIHGLGENLNIDPSKPVTILVPGFINLHCHLAYSKVKLDSQPLFSWLKELYQKTFLDETYSPRSNVLGSLDDLLSFGTTYIVDNCFNLKESFEGISAKRIKATIGLEVFGSDPLKAQEIFNHSLTLLNKFENINPNIELCLSPHAVYDVSKELWRKCVDWSKANNKILLSHIAESEEEELFMQDLNHPKLQSAKEFWQNINTLEAKEKNWQAYLSSVDFLIKNELLFDKLVLAHGVYCNSEDLLEIKKHNTKLINCPRSNEFLKNGIANTKQWQDLSIEFAMGTDSAASNHDLDIRKELAKNKHLSAKEKFDKITIEAAKILGRDQDIGSLEIGKAADFVVLKLINHTVQISKDNIFELMLDPKQTQVEEVYINNSNVYKRSP
jgi:5-methylthioadenosine/S-adenosylhomocysteine deaminase